jgi:hypothetical protein
MHWAFSIRPGRNELLSSYLSRVAFAHGATPFGFYNLHLGDPSFWARDVDRGISYLRHIRKLQDLSSLPEKTIREMTLQGWATCMQPDRYSDQQPPAITPWINAAGVFHRQRRRHSLQFCPHCLLETGQVNKLWRLAFVTQCESHMTSLMDGCPRCDAPFIPHRRLRRTYQCHACSFDLARAESEGRNDMGASLGSTLSRLLMVATLPDLHTPAKDELLGLRTLLALTMWGRRSTATMSLLGVQPPEQMSGRCQLEMSRLPMRRAILLAGERILENWPHSFRSVASQIGLRQGEFTQRGPLPSWLEVEVDRLPKTMQRKGSQAMRDLTQKVSDIATRKPQNWRALRGNMLVRAALKKT